MEAYIKFMSNATGEAYVKYMANDENWRHKFRALLGGFSRTELMYVFNSSVSETQTVASCSFSPRRHTLSLVEILDEMADRRIIKLRRKSRANRNSAKRVGDQPGVV